MAQKPKNRDEGSLERFEFFAEKHGYDKAFAKHCHECYHESKKNKRAVAKAYAESRKKQGK